MKRKRMQIIIRRADLLPDCDLLFLPLPSPMLKENANHLRCSAEKKVIPAKGKALIDTQISIAVPKGCYGRVAPRSGLGA